MKALRRLYDIQPGEKDVATFPLFALFGPALGMTAIIPDMDASKPAQAKPERIVHAIQHHNATNLFGSPALVAKLGNYCIEKNIKLESLKRVLSAGAPANNSALKNLSTALADSVEIHTPYGATECLPVSTVGSDTILRETAAKTDAGAGTCIGRPAFDSSVSVIKITDDAIENWSQDLKLPQGEIGEIVVCSPVATREYFELPDKTRLAKIYDGDAVIHRMGDVGYFDEQERLWFCGRKAHRVETENGTLFTIPVERIFNTHPLVHKSALVGYKKQPVLCVEKAAHQSGDWKEITEELLELGGRHELTRSVREIFYYPQLPVDVRHNSKIAREQLSEWVARDYSRIHGSKS